MEIKPKFKEGQFVKHILDGRKIMIRSVPRKDEGMIVTYSGRYLNNNNQYEDNFFAEFELEK